MKKMQQKTDNWSFKALQPVKVTAILSQVKHQ